MKIDLHCHTKKTKKNEPLTRNVEKEFFTNKIKEADVKFVAITNHNSFDINQYKEFKAAVEDICYVIPGIEFDVIGEIDRTKGHVIVVNDPGCVDTFDRKIDYLLKGLSPDETLISVSELINEFENDDVVYIAHFDKPKQLSENDLDDFQHRLINENRLLREPSNLFTIGVLQSHNHRAMIGSDVKDWNEYEKNTFGNTKFEISNYSNFLKLIDKDVNLITSLLDADIDEKVKVYGNASKKENPFIIPIYDDVNIIFGDKGSGKSEILNSLYDYYISKGLKTIFYSGGDKESWYKSLISNSGSDFDCTIMNVSDKHKKDISTIINYSDAMPVPLKSYYKYYINESSNYKKSKMKSITIQKCFDYSNEKYQGLKSDCKKIDSFIDDLDKFSYKQININKINSVKEMLLDLRNSIHLEYKNTWLNEESKYLLNNYIEKMNEYVAENVGAPAIQTETGFYKFADGRLSLKKSVDNITEIIDSNECLNEIKIGSLGQKGDVKLVTKTRFINQSNCESIEHETLNTNKKELVRICKNFSKIDNCIFKPNVIDLVEETRKYLLKINAEDLDSFISIKRYLSLDGIEYKPSKGELAILSLQHDVLNKNDCDVYLMDEVETNLSSIYINDTIVPLIRTLANAKKKVVIATHDANIAIRTRPSNSILKISNNKIYQTYVGNMFQDSLNEISTGETLSWKEESIKYLEGGKEAFNERGDLYE